VQNYSERVRKGEFLTSGQKEKTANANGENNVKGGESDPQRGAWGLTKGKDF